MSEQATPRDRPCPSCPYRLEVPSGIWEEHEYDKLARYDGSITDQLTAGATRLFYCHTQHEHLCAGWVGTHDMDSNLAVRLNGDRVDCDAVRDYHSPVSLFESGAAAAVHGKRDIDAPGCAAERKILQVLRRQERLERFDQ